MILPFPPPQEDGHPVRLAAIHPEIRIERAYSRPRLLRYHTERATKSACIPTKTQNPQDLRVPGMFVNLVA